MLWLRTTVLALVVAASLAACGQDTGPDLGAAAATPTPSASASASASPSASASAPANDPPVALFFGDSYFVGGGYTDESTSMANLAAQELGWTPIIRGGGGTGFTTGNPEFDLPDYLTQIDDGALDTDTDVDWLVVEGGGNDKDADPALVEQDAVAVLDAAAAAHPEARVVLVGVLDPTVDDFTDTDGVADALRLAAESVGVPYVDPQRWLEGRADLIGPDFDHPLPEGHVLAAQRLSEALAGLA